VIDLPTYCKLLSLRKTSAMQAMTTKAASIRSNLQHKIKMAQDAAVQDLPGHVIME